MALERGLPVGTELLTTSQVAGLLGVSTTIFSRAAVDELLAKRRRDQQLRR